MAIEIDYTFLIDGLFHSINYYRSETPMDINAMPVPISTGISSLTFVDTTAIKGKYYFVRFGAIKNGVEKISDEIRVLAGELWTPANMLSSKVFWLDADSLVSSAGSITQWSDKIGVHHFTTGSASVQPALGMLNGHNMAVFDGVSDYLTNVSTKSMFKNMGQGWAFSVIRRISGANTFSHNCGAVKPTNLRFGAGAAFGSSRTDSGSIVGTPGGSPDGEWGISVYEANWSGGKHYHTLNGHSKLESPSFTAGLTSNTDSADGTTMGLYSPIGAVNKANCEIACLMMGNNGLPSQDEIDRLMGWAAWKWGLVDKLPAAHAYKNAPPVI